MTYFGEPDELDDYIELVGVNDDGTVMFMANLESLDGKTTWHHGGDERDCRRWLRGMLGEAIYYRRAQELLNDHLAMLKGGDT